MFCKVSLGLVYRSEVSLDLFYSNSINSTQTSLIMMSNRQASCVGAGCHVSIAFGIN